MSALESARARALVARVLAVSDEASARAFAQQLEGRDEAWIDRNTTVLQTPSRRGLCQFFANDCAVAVGLVLACQRNPALALAYWMDRETGSGQFRALTAESLAAAGVTPYKHGLSAMVAGWMATEHALMSPTQLPTRLGATFATNYERMTPTDDQLARAREQIAAGHDVVARFTHLGGAHFRTLVQLSPDGREVRIHDTADGRTTWYPWAALSGGALSRLGKLTDLYIPAP